jgi:hypothetical protein
MTELPAFDRLFTACHEKFGLRIRALMIKIALEQIDKIDKKELNTQEWAHFECTSQMTNILKILPDFVSSLTIGNIQIDREQTLMPVPQPEVAQEWRKEDVIFYQNELVRKNNLSNDLLYIDSRKK